MERSGAIKYRGEMRDRQDTGGLTTALQLVGARGEAADGAGGEQADMFEAEAALPLPLAPPASNGKPGRPAGARNKSTEEWVKYFLGRYRSPLTALGELYSRPLGELHEQLQAMADKHKTWVETKDGGRWERAVINPLDVLKMQRDAAVALLPYIHKRQPMALEIERPQRGITILGELDLAQIGGDDDLALPLAPPIENIEEFGTAQPQSDEQKSDGSK